MPPTQPNRQYILALDQGTTSSRAILFDRQGRQQASAQREFRQHFPQPGWVEHDPMDLWRTQLAVARQALRRGGVGPGEVAAIGITNQRETTLAWDRTTGRPVHPAIVWQDRRTTGICDRLRRDGAAAMIQEKTGLIIDAYFSATKLQWMLKQVPEARSLARAGKLAFGTVDSWLLWHLTGGRRHLTDVSNAARTMLFNIHRLEWDEELLRLFGIPRSVLPEVVPTAGELAETSVLGGAIPVGGVAGDQQAALFGQACFRPGMAKNTYGTGCFLVLNTGAKPMTSRNRLLTTIAWKIGDRVEYALEGSVFIAGAVVQWLRDGLGLIRRAADIEALAASVPDNGGVFLVPAFSGLGAPHWDSHARGLVSGLTRGATAAHLARAALEGIAFQVRDVVAAMEADTGLRLKELRVDGGACANNLLMQTQADLLGRTVVRPQFIETTAQGAALLAGLAVGLWPARDAIAAQWQVDRTFAPALQPSARRRMLAGWELARRRACEPVSR
ncbi:MAG: glycerol kinase GlpK [Verrucomicrobiales bacterium]|nr:glycerol kinase GlpK [Verrucomicrobiales bacterium]MCP5519852.1 glycerol kinase GlpK [Verrucomicrobiales bacterium]